MTRAIALVSGMTFLGYAIYMSESVFLASGLGLVIVLIALAMPNENKEV